jgi:hypothetical protein
VGGVAFVNHLFFGDRHFDGAGYWEMMSCSARPVVQEPTGGRIRGRFTIDGVSAHAFTAAIADVEVYARDHPEAVSCARCYQAGLLAGSQAASGYKERITTWPEAPAAPAELGDTPQSAAWRRGWDKGFRFSHYPHPQNTPEAAGPSAPPSEIRMDTSAHAWEDAMANAEKAYAAALKAWRASDTEANQKAKLQAFNAYFLACQRYSYELLRQAESPELPEETRKEAGNRLVTTVDAWARKQKLAYEPLGPGTEAIETWKNYALGCGHVAAGQTEAGFKALDEVIANDLSKFEPGPPREYAAAMRARAICCKARALADAAEWKQALELAGDELLKAAGSDAGLTVQVRILRARCFTGLGDRQKANAELAKARPEAEKATNNAVLKKRIAEQQTRMDEAAKPARSPSP